MPASENTVRCRMHHAWLILLVGTLVVFGSLGLARYGYTMLLPPMQADLGLDNAQAGFLASANLVGYLIMALLGGALAAHFGPRIVISIALFVAGCGMLLTGMADSFVAAAFWRTVTGLGSGASNVPVMGLLAAWFSRRRRGLAAGVCVSGSSLGLMLLGPLVPRVLAGAGDSGWRACWFIFGGITIALAVLAFAVLRNRPQELNLQPLGADSSVAGSLPEAPKGVLLWGCVYRSGTIWHAGLIYAAFGFSYIIYITFFTKYLIAEGGYSQLAAGNLFMYMGWLSLVCGLVWGWISDHLGRRKTLTIIYLIQVLAFTLFAVWRSRAGFTVSAALFGFTAWSIPAVMAALCGDLLEVRLAPAGIGFVTLFFGIAQAVAPGVAGAVADRAGSFAPAMLLAAAAALAGAVGSLLLRNTAAGRSPG